MNIRNFYMAGLLLGAGLAGVLIWQPPDYAQSAWADRLPFIVAGLLVLLLVLLVIAGATILQATREVRELHRLPPICAFFGLGLVVGWGFWSWFAGVLAARL